MSKTSLFDFSGLSTAERIELAEQLWDSLPARRVGTTAAQLEELRLRRAQLGEEDDPGQPWEEVLDDLETTGA